MPRNCGITWPSTMRRAPLQIMKRRQVSHLVAHIMEERNYKLRVTQHLRKKRRRVLHQDWCKKKPLPPEGMKERAYIHPQPYVTQVT